MVKYISISHTASGCIIFQRVYSWSSNTAFSNLGSLIQGLYQFAREVDDGIISGIDFERPNQSVRKKRDDVLRTNRGETMHMITIRAEQITTSIFFHLRGKLVPSELEKYLYQILLYLVKVAFETRFEAVLSTLKPNSQVSFLDYYLFTLLDYIGYHDLCIQEVETMLIENKFVEFNETVDALCEAVLGRSPEDRMKTNSMDMNKQDCFNADPELLDIDYQDKRILEDNIRRYLAKINIHVEHINVNENYVLGSSK